MKEVVSQKELEAFKKGDPTTADIVISKFYAQASSYIYRMTKNRDVAEELTQELFIAMWEKRETFNSPEHLRRFVYTTGTYIVLNYFRDIKISKKHFSDVEVVEAIYDDQQATESKELLMLIKMAVSKMTEPRKTIFEMTHYDGVDAKDVSSQLNIPQPTVYWHLKKAVEDLKKIMPVLIFLFLMVKK